MNLTPFWFQPTRQQAPNDRGLTPKGRMDQAQSDGSQVPKTILFPLRVAPAPQLARTYREIYRWTAGVAAGSEPDPVLLVQTVMESCG